MFGSRCSGISSSQVNEGEMEREKNIFYNCEIEGGFCSIMKVPLASKFGGIFSFFQNLCGYIPYTGSHFALKLHLKKPNSNDHFNIIVEYGEYLTKLSERDAHNNNNKKSKFYYVGKDGLRFYVIDDLIKEIDNALYNLKNEKTINKIIEQLKNIPFDPRFRNADGVYNIPSNDNAIRVLLDILKICLVVYCNDNNLEISENFEDIVNDFNSYSSVPCIGKSMKFSDFIKYFEGKDWLANNYDLSGIRGNNCQDFIAKAVEILKLERNTSYYCIRSVEKNLLSGKIISKLKSNETYFEDKLINTIGKIPVFGLILDNVLFKKHLNAFTGGAFHEYYNFDNIGNFKRFILGHNK